jgi:manganese oxidase
MDQMMGMPFTDYAKMYTERGPHRIGSTYRKAIYREYTDETFTTLKPRPAEWEHAGLLGPVLRAEVGDTIKVVFKNNATHPFTMHPHGVFYAKDSEGVGYNDGASTPHKNGVPSGKTHTYIWEVPERAGPGPNARADSLGSSSSAARARPGLPDARKTWTGSSSRSS